jgi:hypothetical protein
MRLGISQAGNGCYIVVLMVLFLEIPEFENIGVNIHFPGESI